MGLGLGKPSGYLEPRNSGVGLGLGLGSTLRASFQVYLIGGKALSPALDGRRLDTNNFVDVFNGKATSVVTRDVLPYLGGQLLDDACLVSAPNLNMFYVIGGSKNSLTG